MPSSPCQLIPLEIAFEDDIAVAMCGPGYTSNLAGACSTFRVWFWLNTAIDFWFIFDILISFRTGFFEHGTYIDDGLRAAKMYFKGSFLTDAVGSIPVNLILVLVSPGSNVAGVDSPAATDSVVQVNKIFRIIRVAKLVRLTRMITLAKYLEYVRDVLGLSLNVGLVRIFQIQFVSVLTCHTFGCTWWFISDLEIDFQWTGSPWPYEENTWLPPYARTRSMPKLESMPTRATHELHTKTHTHAHVYWTLNFTAMPPALMPPCTHPYTPTQTMAEELG